MYSHASVMLPEVLELLAPKPGGLYLDGTFGGGGHARAILESEIDVKLVAIDQDPEAVVRAQGFTHEYPGRFQFYDCNFEALGDIKETGFDGMLFDLGVSSFQLDQAERGFSFRRAGPVDMRLDPRSGMSAATFLETATEEQLIEAIRNYGEEVQWKRIVAAIIQARGTGILKQTDTLAELIKNTITPRGYSKIHPATKTFQGIRIAVNRELFVIEQVLPIAFEKLAPGGVLAVISFHSLEDRIIKRFFKKMAGRPEHAKDSAPQASRVAYADLITKKPLTATEAEIAENPRSRSAKLRAIRKL